MRNHDLYKRLINCVDAVIEAQATFKNGNYDLCWDEIDPEMQQAIVANFIEYDDREVDCIFGNKEPNDILGEVLRLLIRDDREAQEDLAQRIKSNILDYYEERASELLEERLKIVTSERNHELGLTPILDSKTGECRWVG